MTKKAYEEIMKLLEKTCGFDNLIIIYDKIINYYGSTDIDETGKFINAKLKLNQKNDLKEFNEYEMTIMYDGGYLYSVMSCEFGYQSKDKFIDKLDFILRKYNLCYEEYDNVSLVVCKN
ncbi:MAG: hypothetical protein K0Q47_67 [Sedimentibacter sp.]|jgi:ribosome-associated translation inhibitor RaiA|nr:hypothetical protein [Sedimentibacter sp.]